MIRAFVLWGVMINLSFAVPIPVSLGNHQVVIHYHPGKSPMYVHVHENETTALQAIKKVAPKRQNAWLSLEHQGTRNVRFTFKNQTYEFDPNRMFTSKGRQTSLKQHGHYSIEAENEVKKLANKVTQLIGDRPVVAVHNNNGYSLRDYLPGHPLAREAKHLHFPATTHFRNFLLVTKIQDYCNLKQLQENVVQQHPSVQDDGSLSVYMARKQRYINVEAGYNQLAAQQRMLTRAHNVLLK